MPTPVEPIVITGSGDKTTAPFHINTNEWKLKWSYQPTNEYAMFGFFVYPRGEAALYIESVLFPFATGDTTYVYQGEGDYYIKVSAVNVTSWKIEAQPVTGFAVPSPPIIFAGASAKTTSPVHIAGKEWRIDWSYQPANETAIFGLFVYPRGETVLYIESVLFPPATGDTTYIYQGEGDYYIKVSATNVARWTLEIVE